MIRAVIFDYNGLLVDDLQLHEEAYFKTAKKFGIPITMEKIKEFISLAPEKKVREYFGENLSDEEVKKILEVKTKYYEELVGGNNIVFDGVEEIVDYLSKKYILAIVTNTTKAYFDKFFPKELAAKFKERIFADDIDNPKPAPDSLLRMVERLGLAKEDCIYIGDAVFDAQAAKAAGIKFILIATGNDKKDVLLKEGGKVLDNIKELRSEL